MSPLDLSVEELDKLLTLANDIEKNPQKYAHACESAGVKQGTSDSKKGNGRTEKEY